ncbi:hypothetical protein Q8F55_004575 [Vanrija albida]|uniref:Uncharacterized protein n=1 Tax=Vanrija albida TaxID=181172 RepID=A0ABR3Q7E5_9TREE
MVDKDKPDSKRGERDDPSPPLLGADIARIALSLVLPVLSAVFLGLSFLPSPRRGPFFRPTSLGASSADLTFGPVNFAGHSNWVYRDGATAAQVVLSS